MPKSLIVAATVRIHMMVTMLTLGKSYPLCFDFQAFRICAAQPQRKMSVVPTCKVQGEGNEQDHPWSITAAMWLPDCTGGCIPRKA